MPSKEMITKVWIEEGCIVCDACETACPEVFDVQEDTCLIKPEALDVEFTKPLTGSIEDAAEECPVDVIKFDTAPFQISDAEAAAAKAKEAAADEAPSPPDKSPEAPVAPTDVPAKTPEKKPPLVAAVPSGDPTIQALLQATTSRGGVAGIERKNVAMPEEVAQWERIAAQKLPPDIRHARALQAAAQEGQRAQKQDPKKDDPSRRSVVSAVALGCGWACFGGATALSIGPAFARFMMPNVLEEPDPRVRVGPKEKYADMAINDVNEDFKPQGVWMIRQEGHIAALNIICTHLGCIPNWLPNDFKFKCPCHGSGFKPGGINFEGPAPRPLERFKIAEVEGLIIVDKSKKFQQERGDWANPDSFVSV